MKRGLSGGSCRDPQEYQQTFVNCTLCGRLYPVLTTDGGKDFVCPEHKEDGNGSGPASKLRGDREG